MIFIALEASLLKSFHFQNKPFNFYLASTKFDINCVLLCVDNEFKLIGGIDDKFISEVNIYLQKNGIINLMNEIFNHR
jgi:hypothetical protein